MGWLFCWEDGDEEDVLFTKAIVFTDPQVQVQRQEEDGRGGGGGGEKKKEKKSNLSVLHNPRGHQAALLGAELPGDKAERERLLVLLAPP